jgi:hypothetical protein
MDMKECPNQNWIDDKLDLLAPAASPSPQAARARLETRISKKENTMWRRVFGPKYRPAWVTLMAVAVLGIALSFPQVRVIANSFLGLFRVEKIEAVDVGISLEALPGEMENRFQAAEDIFSDQVIIDKMVVPQEVGTIAEAGQLAGFQARMPIVPVGPTHIHFQEATTVRLVIDRERWQALLVGMGYDDFVIPESADGAEVVFNIPAAVIVGIGDCEYNEVDEVKLAHPDTQNCTIFLQGKSPIIEAPPGVDINRAGQIMLQALGMSEAEATEFSATVNWATTLVIPVPSDMNYTHVTVEGVDGIFLEGKYDGQGIYSLVWLKDGILHALIGDGTLSDALRSANSLE